MLQDESLKDELAGTTAVAVILKDNRLYCVGIAVTVRERMLNEYLALIIFLNLFCNAIIFAICTSTFIKLCINVYSGMYKSAQ
jgi:hypothetical protein